MILTVRKMIEQEIANQVNRNRFFWNHVIIGDRKLGEKAVSLGVSGRRLWLVVVAGAAVWARDY